MLSPSDRIGRVYVGYEQGLDRLDPASGAITHFGQLDGVPASIVHAALARSRRQHLGRHPARPGADDSRPGTDPAAAPRPHLERARAAGLPFPISQLGAATLDGPRIDSGRRLLEIEFFGIAARLGERLRFEYRLDEGDWSQPTYRRGVTYASLPSGAHRIEVRAINLVGLRSAQPASVAFEVVRPLWQTWWALLSAGLMAVGVATALYRFRIAQLIHVERMRARIATDLHDDIGASLSQIAMLARWRSAGRRSSDAAVDRLAVDDRRDIARAGRRR